MIPFRFSVLASYGLVCMRVTLHEESFSFCEKQQLGTPMKKVLLSAVYVFLSKRRISKLLYVCPANNNYNKGLLQL